MSIDFIKNSKGKKIMVQMKNGNYLNGILENIDMFMNIKMKEITYTSKAGNSFYNATVAFIRGSQVASINFEEDLLDHINQKKSIQEDTKSSMYSNPITKEPNQFLNKKRNHDDDDDNTISNNKRGRGNDRGGYRGRGNDRGRYTNRNDRGSKRGMRGR